MVVASRAALSWRKRHTQRLDSKVTMSMKRASPLWLKVLIVIGLLGALVCFIGAGIYSIVHEWPQNSPPPALFGQLMSGAVISFGVTIGLGLVHTAFVGCYYSGFAGRRVCRDRDPLHFWLLLALIGLLPVAIIVYGIREFMAV